MLPRGGPDPGAPDGDRGICIQSTARSCGDGGRLGKEKYLLLYLSDSKLTPRWLYAGLLRQMGLKPHYFSGDSKRLLQKEICAASTGQG